jgi:SAM-dependent methyltransferase
MVLDARAFTAFEQTAHDRIADSYAAHFAPLTSLALEPLLDAAQIAPGQQVLDVATGPGIAAAAAQERKATTIGVDVSANMIALAQVDHPEVTFHTAEVTSLPFASGAFDAVICNFGLGHFPEPEVALAECMRVLVPGGRLAFSWWDHPARQRVQGLFREAIAELGLPTPAAVPQGHDTLRFSDPDAFTGLLRGAELDRVRVIAHSTTHLMPDVDALWQAGMGGMAVTGAAIAAQDTATQALARDVIARRAEAYRNPQGLAIPISFLIGNGRKPTGSAP